MPSDLVPDQVFVVCQGFEEEFFHIAAVLVTAPGRGGEQIASSGDPRSSVATVWVTMLKFGKLRPPPEIDLAGIVFHIVHP